VSQPIVKHKSSAIRAEGNAHKVPHAWPNVPSGRSAMLLALQYQMAKSEKLPATERDRLKFWQLHALLTHAAASLPFVSERLQGTGFSPNTPLTKEIWSKIPVLTRDDVRANSAKLTVDTVPEGHGRSYQIRTSGSTGMPLTASGTGLVQLFWDALTLRESEWHGRDSRQVFHAIRRTNKEAALPDGARYQGWGRAYEALGKSGPVFALDIETDIDGQLNWLQRNPPRYLLTYPTNLAALVRRARERDLVFQDLEQVITVSETVTLGLRQAVRAHWQVPIMDLYSAQEVGYIALQAPEGDHYLVPEEVIHVEVLDERDQPVKPGEIGRVVVTPLHNYAMPLIRYDIGDYAELGDTGSDENTLMRLNRILGRSRGMLTFPDGSRHWPHLPYENFEKAAGVKQYQLVQHTKHDLEFRCVVAELLTPTREQALTEILHEGLGYPFNIRFTEVAGISRSASGKFEDFISKV
jgi:phenylacetate-coenzyme A ligase PaaK-like adenylate-forming protein